MPHKISALSEMLYECWFYIYCGAVTVDMKNSILYFVTLTILEYKALKSLW